MTHPREAAAPRVALSVIVPAFRRVAALARVLAGLAAQECLADPLEVIVVVDGGAPDVCALLGDSDYTKDDAGARRYIVIPEGGPAVARNAGAAEARGDRLLFLDDDIIPAPTLARAHVDLHRRDPDAVGLGKIDLDAARRLTPFERYLYGFYDTHYRKMDGGHRPTFWDALTGNLSTPAEAFRAAGGFDAAFSLLRHEDIEFAYRLARAGLRFAYLPAAVGYHQYVKTFERGCHEAYVNGVSSVMLVARHPELRDQALTRRWAALPPVARPALRALLRMDRARVMGWMAALRAPAERTPGMALLFYRTAYHLNFWHGVRDAQNGRQPRV
ncbi:MAG: glycosyltransferase [Anaerolineae bacterium]|nr:glycosyltransferase [Anaerolineae bacterium]